MTRATCVEILQRHVAAQRTAQRRWRSQMATIFGGLGLGLGLVLLWQMRRVYGDFDEVSGHQWAPLAIPAGLLVLAIVTSLLPSGQQNDVAERLASPPFEARADVLWMYPASEGAKALVVFVFRDGVSQRVEVVENLTLVRELAPRLPGTLVGYTPQNELAARARIDGRT